MKLINFNKHGNFDTCSVLRMVMNQNPRGMLLDEMRRRIDVLKQLNVAGAVHVVLAEDDFTLITDALKTYPYGVAHEDLLALIDEVIASGAPPVIMLANGKDKSVKKGAAASKAAPAA